MNKDVSELKVMINQQQEQVIDGSIEQLDKWWKEATGSIFQTGQLIHCVDIDGKTFYTGYEQYLFLNVDQIQCVNINSLSRLESIVSTEQELDQYLSRFIPAAKSVVNQLYGGLNQENAGLLSQLVQGLEWISSAIALNVKLYMEETENLPEYLAEITSVNQYISVMHTNIQQDDFVGVSDVLEYEIIPALENYHSQYKEKVSA
ncbi:Uncharacterised protein [Paenibacillus macerans]|uniref:DUF8042 domain-containing protein n=1 Tax=Paenibacillus macerans TaxID=44252 RepID=A0A090ZBN5_PAEMA|nr:hypothetical protein DJ90_3817 [Paenibacillus macerans]SUD25812.1 Uncharacterised protein [Paenibacillus macerans]